MVKSSGCVSLALWLLAMPPLGHGPSGMLPSAGRDDAMLGLVQGLRAEGLRGDQTLAIHNADLASAPRSMVKRLKWVFAQEGVPQELVWIAEVESAFDQAATSRSGAAGLFQLMPDTARRFGLEVSARCDERRHPVKSAVVAARYLRELHRQFGSWMPAVAAYHAGEGRVQRAMDLRAEAGPTGSWAERLPAPTQEYVEFVFNIVAAEEGVGPEGIPAPAHGDRPR